MQFLAEWATTPIDQIQLINTAIVIVAILLLLILTFSHFKNPKQRFEFTCNEHTVSCSCPGFNIVEYQLELAEITEIRRYVPKQQGSECFYLIDKSGKEYELPSRFGFDARKAIKVIKSFRSDLQVNRPKPKF